MKRLLLLRHAQTEQANKDTPADSERQLTEQGQKDATKIGRALADRNYSADLIVCSPSRRTRQTLELATSQWRSTAKVEFVDAIYAASAQRLVKVIHALPDSAAAVLMIGHNPGMEDCLALLTPREQTPVDANGKGTPHRDFPTAALALLDFTVAKWPEILAHSGVLAEFIRPKNLIDT